MTLKELIKRHADTQRAFEKARADAEAIANRESEALGDDDSYIRWVRHKKVAERDAAQLQNDLAALADEIEAERGRLDRAALQRRYDAVKAKNEDCQARLHAFAKNGAPELLRLLRDLAQDQIDVEQINHLVPWEGRIMPADTKLRCTPSSTSSTRGFTPAEDLPPLWKTIVIPRVGKSWLNPLYNGQHTYSPQNAIEMIDRALNA